MLPSCCSRGDSMGASICPRGVASTSCGRPVMWACTQCTVCCVLTTEYHQLLSYHDIQSSLWQACNVSLHLKSFFLYHYIPLLNQSPMAITRSYACWMRIRHDAAVGELQSGKHNKMECIQHDKRYLRHRQQVCLHPCVSDWTLGISCW